MREGHVPYEKTCFAEALEADTSAAEEPERQNLRLTLAQRDALGTRRQRVEHFRVLQITGHFTVLEAIDRNHPVIARNDTCHTKCAILLHGAADFQPART